MYRIFGGDGKEYGPVSADTLRQWVREGRANAQTQVKPEGATTWQPLGAIPEIAAEFSAPGTIAPLTSSSSATPASPGAVHDGDYELDIFGCLSRAFELFKGNMGPMLLATLIGFSPQIIGFVVRLFSIIPLIGILFSLLGFVISIATIVIGGPLIGGLYSVLLKIGRGQRVETNDSFAGFKNCFLHLFLGQLVPGIFVGLCLVPLIVVAVVTVIITIVNDPQHNPPTLAALIPTLIALVVTIPVVAWLRTNWAFTLALVIDKNLDFWTAMKTSWRQVMRHWWTVFGLMLVCGLINFVGLLACGIGLLFTVPITLAAMMQAYETIFNTRTTQPGAGA